MNQSYLFEGREIVWFSCGAASACAAKLASEAGDIENLEVCYCDTLEFEHPDNIRFLSDVQQWIGRPIKLLKSDRFQNIFDVFVKERYLNGPSGAPCTRALKRNVRKSYQQANDTHILGFTVEEEKRIVRFEKENPGLRCNWNLRDAGMNKSDCLRMIRKAGIEVPAMYRLGYQNNNCIGCVKGGAGYWNKIRIDFPESFDRMAKIERWLGFALLKIRGKPCYLDELPPDAGRYDSEPDIECGVQCVKS